MSPRVFRPIQGPGFLGASQPRRQERLPREADQAALRVQGCSGDGVQVPEEVARPVADDEREYVVRVEIEAGEGAVAGGAHLDGDGWRRVGERAAAALLVVLVPEIGRAHV